MMLVRSLVTVSCMAAISCTSHQPLVELSNDGEFIEYAGSITLSGFYFSDQGNIETQDFVCFWPNSDGQALLPKGPDVKGYHWMCFSNGDEAKNLFDPGPHESEYSGCYKGLATVSIKDYSRYIAESEGISFAELTHVYQHSAATPLPCESMFPL